jgi:hypothetical protein
MTNVIQFPTVKTTDELLNLTAEAAFIQSLKIDVNKPSKIVKRTLNDVSPNEWDRVAAQSYKNNPVKMK